MLRLYLPPNLASAAARDAIPVKVEVDLGQAPPDPLLPALATLQRFGAKPARTLFLQLRRAQLRELAGVLAGQPVFFRVDDPARPFLWVGTLLRGVSEFLTDPLPDSAPGAAVLPNPPLPAGPTRTSVPGGARGAARGSVSAELTPLEIDGSEHYLAISLPSREHAAYGAVLELLKSSGFALEPSNRRWWLRDRHKVLNFLASHRRRLEAEFRARFTPNFERNTRQIDFAAIRAEAREEGGEFTLDLGLDAGQAPPAAIDAAVASGRGYIEDRGRVYLLDPTHLRKLAEARRALAGDAAAAGGAGRRVHRLGTARLAEAEQLVEDLAPHFERPEGWRRRSEALRSLAALEPAPVPEPLASQLRPYQRIGIAWLRHLHLHGLGGILADEMGLGKTLQALGLVGSLLAEAGPAGGRHRPALVVCPASLLETWRREAARFLPSLRVRVHHGAGRAGAAAVLAEADLVVTSYGTLVRDQELLGALEFLTVVADEAQHAKNRRSQNAQALRSLRSTGRCLLTGTPLENSFDDLRSLFAFLMPGFLPALPPGLRGDDRAWHDERLRIQVAPYLLRRTKAAVAAELPPKIEQVVWCELTPSQAALYRSVQEQTERELLDLEASGAAEGTLRLAALTQLLRLRQVCCDPRLLPGVDPGVVDSAKLDAFRELVAEATDDGHRLLVFSQFTSLLSLLRADLESQEIPYTYLDGSMSARDRQAAVDRFQGDATVPVFLLSLRAGGTGLTLTGADTVVHFDPWWNPAVEAQATDRAHRIGQRRVVTSYKLICSGTVEEKVLALQESKRTLLADVFEASAAAAARLSLADLRDLLR